MYRNLEIWVIGHLRSLEIVSFEGMARFVFALHSSCGPIPYRFQDKS